MRPIHSAIAVAVLTLAAAGVRGAAVSPDWAYGLEPAAPAVVPAAAPTPAAPTPPDTTPHQVPGSSRSFTVAQISDAFGPADWFPEDHAPMPDIVAHGRRPDIRACAFCHYPNGMGRPSNGGVSGLPVSYFIQTINDFKNGLRKSAEPRKANTNQMIAFAKAMTPEEVRIAAEYFASVPRRPWIKVVEAAMVPKTEIEGNIFFRLPGSDTEPIGKRIIETPENTEQTEPLRNPRSGFIAYAPVGSLARGRELVLTGANGRTVQCSICHGADLKGLAGVPGIAGRSPSYLARQMYDIQAGSRHGEWAALMKPVVERLTDDDLIAISAYVASRP